MFNTATTLLRTASATMGLAGGVKSPELKLLEVTPTLAATILVKEVTPMAAGAAPTLGTTANRDWLAPKGLLVLSRSSKYVTLGPPDTLTTATPLKPSRKVTTAVPSATPLRPSLVTELPSNSPDTALKTCTPAPAETPPKAGLTVSLAPLLEFEEPLPQAASSTETISINSMPLDDENKE
uniref:hypothetical protein n=1 Tax=Limnohabitans sp. TaxID=1907725 RepID=UPI004048228B